ncbi:hypothetical protein, variant [Puccinia triticina 1-1 BBBD Race 1]|uniref:cystathionine gamma-lyase n=1 Tax=Puccinia triticina (isolate 1-1 / race 1 (BBBD)) TaxID=630390 RepID=A0A0C4EWK0_PUCT1|nr:hypothetical protein PTTG_05195 [Puccinia triticina 1-1 BBBD Race 1]OAV95070.1 hypothetical protein, variant [Puccinia triticina 1-1 BBBD Race 1]
MANPAPSDKNAHGEAELMTSNPHSDHLHTRLIHVGAHPDPSTGAVIRPISLSSTFAQSAVGVHAGFEYSRSLNPNRLDLETLIASLEGVDKLERVEPAGLPLPGALAVSSGSAATATIINALVGPGAHLVAMSDVYGGTYRYLNQVAKQLGIASTMIDLGFADDSKEAAEIVIKRLQESIVPGRTKLLWIETPTNPTLRLVDIACVSAFAKKNGLLLVVDNTFLSPFYQQPLRLGADIVVHSATKYINGHSDVVLGVIISPHLDLINKMRFLQNAHGAVPSAFDCWLAQRGLKTLALRMLRHGTNALAIATWLQDVALARGWITKVTYIGLQKSEIAWRQIPKETQEELHKLGYGPSADGQHGGRFPYGGMISFKIKPKGGAGSDSQTDYLRADAFLKNCRLFTLAESLGGIESLASLPAKMTHATLSVEDRSKLGIDGSLVRLSVGIENVDDLIADLEQSLAKSF